MTKRHFIRAADIVDNLRKYNTPCDASVVATAFIELFSAYNDRFDTQRFLVACGLVEPAPKVKRGKAA